MKLYQLHNNIPFLILVSLPSMQSFPVLVLKQCDRVVPAANIG